MYESSNHYIKKVVAKQFADDHARYAKKNEQQQDVVKEFVDASAKKKTAPDAKRKASLFGESAMHDSVVLNERRIRMRIAGAEDESAFDGGARILDNTVLGNPIHLKSLAAAHVALGGELGGTVQQPSAPSATSQSAKSSKKAERVMTCTGCVSRGFPSEHCEMHRSDSKLHCPDCYMYKTHKEGCSLFGTVVTSKQPKKDPMGGWHANAFKLEFIFFTIVVSGKDIPSSWFDSFKSWLESMVTGDGGDYLMTQERGTREHLLHLHVCLGIRMPATPAARTRLKANLKSHMCIPVGMGAKIGLETRTQSGHHNTKKYIAKDYNKPWHKFASNYLTQADVDALGKEYGESTYGDYEKKDNILKPAGLLQWADSQRNAWSITSAGVGDLLLWAVKAGEIALSITFVTPKGGTSKVPSFNHLMHRDAGQSMPRIISPSYPIATRRLRWRTKIYLRT